MIDVKIQTARTTKWSIIFSADYDFQVIAIYPVDLQGAWDIANDLLETGVLNVMGVEHYDVITYDSLAEMNKSLINLVTDSRKSRKT